MKKNLILLFSVFIILSSCSNTKKQITGCWLDDGEIIILKKDGKLIKGSESGTWQLVGEDRLNFIWSNGENDTHTIVTLSNKLMIIKYNGFLEFTWNKVDCESKNKAWNKPTQSDFIYEWHSFIEKNVDKNLLPYFFKADFDNNGIKDEVWILYSEDKKSMAVFAYMNNNKTPIEISTFDFTYNSYIYELPIGKHQVYYKYNAITDEENDIHEKVTINKGIVFFNDRIGDFYLWENGKFEQYAYSNY